MRQFESGTSVRKRTRMRKAGSKRVRKVLYMAACSAIAHPNAWRSEYDRLKGNGENPWNRHKPTVGRGGPTFVLLNNKKS